MKQDLNQSSLFNILITAASLVIIIAGMHAAETLLVPLLLATFVSLLSTPLLLWMQRQHIPMMIALIMVIALILGILISLAILIGASLDDFTRNLPAYQTRSQDQITALITWLNQLGLVISQEQILKYFDPGVIFNLVGNLLGGLGSMMTNGFLIFLTIIFMLGEASGFPAKLRSALGEHYSSDFFDAFTRTIQRYMGLKTVISMVTGILIGAWLAVIGVDYPVLWGLIAFLFNFIPNIGSIMAGVPAVLLALIDLGLWPALYAALGYLAVNITIGELLEPRIIGKRLGLSTLVVFLSLVVWAWVLGPVGMFLSVPLTMTIKIALDSNEDTRWIAVLLGSETTSIESAGRGDDLAPKAGDPGSDS